MDAQAGPGPDAAGLENGGPENGGPGEHVAFSEALIGLGDHPGERLKVREVVESFGDRAFGAIMLVVALISILPLPPGGSTLTGAPLVLLCFQLALGHERLWLPRFMLDASVPRIGFRKAVGRASRTIRAVERLSRPRMFWLVSPLAQRLIGMVGLLLSIELVLPIPLGNMAPAAAIALLALGVMQRDGLAVFFGGVLSGVSVGLLVLVWKTVALAVTHIIDRLAHLI